MCFFFFGIVHVYCTNLNDEVTSQLCKMTDQFTTCLDNLTSQTYTAISNSDMCMQLLEAVSTHQRVSPSKDTELVQHLSQTLVGPVVGVFPDIQDSDDLVFVVNKSCVRHSLG